MCSNLFTSNVMFLKSLYHYLVDKENVLAMGCEKNLSRFSQASKLILGTKYN